MPAKTFALDSYDDPFVEVMDFVNKHGNPVFIYQGGPDDVIGVISTRELDQSQLKKYFEPTDEDED